MNLPNPWWPADAGASEPEIDSRSPPVWRTLVTWRRQHITSRVLFDQTKRSSDIFGLPLVGRLGANTHEDGPGTERRDGKTIGNDVVTNHPDRLSGNRVCSGGLEHPRMRLLVAHDARCDDGAEMSREPEPLDQLRQFRDVVRDHDVPPSRITQPVQHGFNVGIDGVPLCRQDVSSDCVESVRRRRLGEPELFEDLDVAAE